ncbi:MAG TPA: hypothetical protein VK900_10530 [Anaerolineales bacterium]|nr:hypothetical protein [Anaerolineales bacterium]
MNSSFKQLSGKPVFILIAINLIIGIFIFRDYGYSWDEPFFYDYASALGYAYSPQEWLSEDFDLTNAYGASGDDHKTRGPAYLLLARGPVQLLEFLGLDRASAWHLINFIVFQLGIYFLYRLALRWVSPSAGFAAAALFAWQPLLWGHAFINPKDPPFLVFFLGSVCLGFEMVDRLVGETPADRQRFSKVVLPALFLGFATSIRVLGPLAGLLVLAYAAWKMRRRLATVIAPLVLYAAIAIATMLVTWPYLWEDPLARFAEVFSFMSDNPTSLSVLFGGEVYHAGELPRAYLPFMLATTLTESVWPLFFVGLLGGFGQMTKQLRDRHIRSTAENAANDWTSLRSSLDVADTRNQLVSLILVLLWFLLLIAYVLLLRPAMYDGLRHFLFILPPVFIFIGIAFDLVSGFLSPNWLRAGLIVLILAPGIAGMYRLHPYEYTYYNSFIGGTDGAFRQYETDYWLTCYKDAVEELNATVNQPLDLYVHREAYIADDYAEEDIIVHDLRGAQGQVQPGDYILVNTRTNEDRRIFNEAPPLLQIGRGEAVFCVVKQVP